MRKVLLFVLAVMVSAAFILEVPSAYAIFGIRAARAVMAARKAKKMASSDTSTSETDAEAQGTVKSAKPTDPEKKEAVKVEDPTWRS